LEHAALFQDLGQLAGQRWHDDRGGFGAGHDDGLLGQRLGDLGRESFCHARCLGLEYLGDLAGPGLAQLLGGAEAAQ